ncbi:MAG: hypothetical protein JSR80_05945 [Verrucomicrobia bacterium]|nr:hypothetical protein [Verrucomicrobiota bacterium]
MVTYEYLPNTNLVTAKFTHDERGNVIQEMVYDADGELTYVNEKEYNERGDLLSGTNLLITNYTGNNRITPVNGISTPTMDINSRLDHLISHRGECQDPRDHMGKDRSDAYEQQEKDKQEREYRQQIQANEDRLRGIRRNNPPHDNREIRPEYGNRPCPRENQNRPLHDPATEQRIHELHERAAELEKEVDQHWGNAMLIAGDKNKEKWLRAIEIVRELAEGKEKMDGYVRASNEAVILANTGKPKDVKSER